MSTNYIIASELSVKRLYHAITAEDTVVGDMTSIVSMAIDAASLSVNDVENHRHKAIYDFLQPLGLSVREKENYLSHIDQFIQSLITHFHKLGIRDAGKVKYVAMFGMDIIVNVDD